MYYLYPPRDVPIREYTEAGLMAPDLPEPTAGAGVEVPGWPASKIQALRDAVRALPRSGLGGDRDGVLADLDALLSALLGEGPTEEAARRARIAALRRGGTPLREDRGPGWVPLREYTTTATGGRVDRAAGVIYGVKILGEKGNATYPRATRERAAPLMEGCRVYVDHAPRDRMGETRSYWDQIGTLHNVRESGTGLVADFRLNLKHPLAEAVLYDAEHQPGALGFSIASQGRCHYVGGEQICEEIIFDREAHSVDLVSRPATTRGLFESREFEDTADARRARVARLRGR